MFDLMRWTTVHPALVHFALGTIPVLLLAYGLGAARKSERWTFVGDVTLWVTAVATFLAAVFGLVALLLLSWPGGLGLYKWLHLALGLFGSALVIGLAVVRWRARQRKEEQDHPVRWSSFGVTALGSVVLIAAGWVGGEVLVYRSGMAVEAAGRGALAQPLFLESGASPANLHDAMKQVRGHWARATTTLSTMLVEQPDDERFRVIEAEAQHLNLLGRWLAEREAREQTESKASQATRERDAHAIDFAARAHAQAATHGQEQGGRAADGRSIEQLAQELVDAATALADAAHARDIDAVAGAYGALTRTCATCHAAHRWNADHEH